VVADRFQYGWLESVLGVGRNGAVIDECRSPLEALQRAERLSFDICFLDDRFGERAMLRFLHTVRAWGTPFPTVVLAAPESEELVVKALEAGAVDYLYRGQASRMMLRRAVRHARETHELERRRRDWQKRHRDLFERSQAPAYQLTADGTVLHCNQAFVQLLGYRTKEDVIGKPLLHAEPPARTTPQPLERVGQRAFLAREACLCRADGDQVWVRMSDTLTSLEGDGLQVFEGTALDVSQAKHFEDLLRSREAQYLALYDVIAEGMLVLGEGGRIKACNRRAEILLGLEIGEILGTTFDGCFTAVYGTDRRSLPLRELAPQHTLETGEPVTGQVIGFRRRDGGEGWASIRSTSVLVPGASSRSTVLVTLTDQTRLKALESQLMRAQKNEVVGRLASGMAHEFRNLLTAVAGYSELLASDESLSQQAVAAVDEIRRAAKRATSLAGQMLDFTRRDELHIAPLDLDEVMGTLRGMLERLVGGRVRLTLELDSAGRSVAADHGQIEQVLLNLVLNARDALTGGGRIWLRTERVELEVDAAEAEVVLRSGSYVVLTVEDDGAGMDEHTRRRAFEPFFTTKEPGKGTGLGLPAVRDIIRSYGGDVLLHSQPRGGTTVRLFLPSTESSLGAP
jgi:two-component system cell cycle sensor histidine kinase/response regulator CckA